MIAAEFNAWLDHHRSFFPGIDTWLAKLDENHRNNTLRAWAKTLEHVPVSIARQATEQLYHGETIPVYERHAAVIRRTADAMIAKRQRQQNASRFGPGSVKCWQCKDTGLVSIYVAGELLKRNIANVGPEAAAKRTALARCGCDACHGRDEKLTPFDPELHVVATSNSWAWLQIDRPGDYERRLEQVEQAQMEMAGERSHRETSGMAVATAETEF